MISGCLSGGGVASSSGMIIELADPVPKWLTLLPETPWTPSFPSLGAQIQVNGAELNNFLATARRISDRIIPLGYPFERGLRPAVGYQVYGFCTGDNMGGASPINFNVEIYRVPELKGQFRETTPYKTLTVAGAAVATAVEMLAANGIDGTFATADGWTAGAGWTLDGTNADFVGTTGQGLLQTAVIPVPSEFLSGVNPAMLLEWDMVNLSADDLFQIEITDPSVPNNPPLKIIPIRSGASNHHAVILNATEFNSVGFTEMRLGFRGFSGTFSIDLVKLNAVEPNNFCVIDRIDNVGDGFAVAFVPASSLGSNYIGAWVRRYAI